MMTKESLIVLASNNNKEVIFDKDKPGYRRNIDFDRLLSGKEGIEYLPPECLGYERLLLTINDEEDLHRIDVWGGGATILEALSSYQFSRGLTLNFNRNSEHNKYRFHMLSYVTAADEPPPRNRVEFDVLVNTMLRFDSQSRITGEQLHRLWVVLRKRIIAASETEEEKFDLAV